MIRKGRVVSKEAGVLKVCFERPAECEKCGACMDGRRKVLLSVSGDAQIGDTVTVRTPDAKILKASLLTYALPLCGLMLGLGLGALIFPGSEGLIAVSGLVLTGITYLALRIIDSRLRQKGDWAPQLIDVEKTEEVMNHE